MRSSKKFLYVVGGRSACGSDPGRKISAILDCWRKLGHPVEGVFGGDIQGGSAARGEKEFGSDSYYRQWRRRIGILDPFVRTISEQRDIQHDAAMVKHLEGLCDSFKPDFIWERSCRLHCAGLVTAKRLHVPYVLEWKDHLVDYRFSLFSIATKASSLETPGPSSPC